MSRYSDYVHRPFIGCYVFIVLCWVVMGWLAVPESSFGETYLLRAQGGFGLWELIGW